VKVLVGGSAAGEVIRLDEGLSFWGGFDAETGLVIDRAHPQHGQSLAGLVVWMPHGRGSSSSSAVLAEALRLGTGPAAIAIGEPDSIVVTGSLVARLLYGAVCPVVVADSSEIPDGWFELAVP
jgi:predicted aconitase with swiveling domain